MNKVIDQEGVITGVLKHAIIYGKGAHSADLQEKGLLPEGTADHTAHHIVLPIITIESAILELLSLGISQEDIISFAGVMAKAPNGIPSVHALWGPAAKTNLKIAVAMETFGKSNVLMAKLLERMTSKEVTIIETNKPEHDSKMAIIQGLINLWLVMVGETANPDIQSQLIQKWKTPTGTIVDMIHANPFAEIVIQRFFESLPHHKYNISSALEGAVEANLTSEDLAKFGTPNSARVIDFISKQTGKIILGRDAVVQLQADLNLHGHKSLAERITRIRPE